MADFDWDDAARPKEGATPDELGRSIMAPKVGAGETFINRAVNMVPVGGRVVDAGSGTIINQLSQPSVHLTDDAKAAIEARGEKVPDGESLLQSYRNARDTRAMRTAAGEEQNPLVAKLGTGAGLLLSMLAPFPSFKSAPGAGALGKIGTAGLNGLGYGMLGGLTEGAADLTKGEFGQGAIDMLLGGGLGGVLGLGAGTAGQLGSKLLGLLKGAYEPAPAAQALIDRGVKDLTLGQMTPGSSTAHLEGAATDVPGFGPMLKAQRQAGTQSFQGAVLNEGAAPGHGPLKDGSVAEKLSEAYDSFKPAYDAVRSNVVEPVGPGGPLAEALPAAADDVGVLADDMQRGAVRKYTQGQVGLIGPKSDFALPPPGGGGARPVEVTADRLLQARSNLRGQIADALKRQDYPTAQLLQKAEAEITGALETQLPPEASAALKQTDAQYAKHKVVQNAVGKAKDNPDGFTSAQLGDAVKSATEPGAYARGQGGPLRDLASAGREVFAETPRTGVKDLIMGVPGAKHVTAGSLAIGNMPTPKKFLLGGFGFQEKLRALENAFVQRELAKALQKAGGARSLGLSAAEDMLAPPTPAFATDEDEQRRKAMAQLLGAK